MEFVRYLYGNTRNSWMADLAETNNVRCFTTIFVWYQATGEDKLIANSNHSRSLI
jgi:hypothetical protein